ncbi:MAG: RHS repeat protein, partial [Proteobacteria bacterium]|nr:RHS repeat protein [Pseudomonadota bacterium]
MYLRETDYVSADPRLQFSRIYNSSQSGYVSTTIGNGWQGELDGMHVLSMKGALPQRARFYAEVSSMYTNASDACVKGVAEVVGGGAGGKPDPQWKGVTGTYDGAGHCNLSNGTSIPVLGTGGQQGLAGAIDVVGRGFGLRLKDGTVHALYCNQGVCSMPGYAGTTPYTITIDTSGFHVAAEDGSVQFYDYLGYLQTITYKDGYQLAFTYQNDTDGTGLLDGGDGSPLSIADNRGRVITFGYDANGLLSALSAPDGQTITYTHDAHGQLTAVKYPTGTRTYQYTSTSFPSGLTALIDENGKTVSTWAYDAYGRATSNVGAGGVEAFSFAYNTGNTVVTDPLGVQRTYAYASPLGFPQISTIAGPLCPRCTLGASNTYDPNGYLSSSTDWNGHVTGYAFDAGGELHQRVDGQGTAQQRTTTIDWDDTLHNPLDMSVQDASGHTAAQSNWTYNARGEPLTLTRTDPATNATRTWTYTYCEQADVTAGTCPLPGLLLSVDGPRTDVSDVTRYSYYPTDDSTCATVPTTCPHRMGDLWRITNALKQITTVLSYDGAGRPLAVLDANGVATDLTYNARGWLTQVAVRAVNSTAGVGDAVTGYGYDATGNLTKITRPDGSYLAFTYDAAHRLTDIADTLGDRIHYTLDNAGNRLREDTKDPSGALKHSVVRQFNTLGQLAKTLNADGKTVNGSYHYDPNGNPDIFTDGRGTLTSHRFDALDRLVHVEADPGAAPHVEANIDYTRDALDRITKVIDPQGLATTYQFDGLDNLTQLASPDTGTASATFDAAGDVLTRTDARGVKASYTYDALGRVKTIHYPTAALNVTYTWDTTPSVCSKPTQGYSVGHLTAIADGSGSTQFCFDRFGNVVKKVAVVNGKTFTTSYVWNLAHRLTQETTPTGTVIAYARDAAGRVARVTYTPSGGTAKTLVSA